MYSIYGKHDKFYWDKYYKSLNINDIYYKYEYHMLAATQENSEAVLYLYEDDNGVVFYPFLKKKITEKCIYKLHPEEKYYDIESTYGFGGPLFFTNKNKELLIDGFRKNFDFFCKSNEIIAEFIRFHPLRCNHIDMNKYINIINANEIVYLNMDNNLDTIWRSYKHCNRKNIKKAENSGIRIIFEETGGKLDDFLNIYIKTMDRNQASDYYYFSREYFNNICNTLNGDFIYFYAIKDEKIISSELILYDQNYAYSFLGGTLEEYFEYRPNNLLKHEIIKELKRRGIRYYVLGGGHKRHDGIYDFKKSFSPNGTTDFYIGTKIHNEKVYFALIHDWENRNNRKAELFLQYRY